MPSYPSVCLDPLQMSRFQFGGLVRRYWFTRREIIVGKTDWAIHLSEWAGIDYASASARSEFWAAALSLSVMRFVDWSRELKSHLLLFQATHQPMANTTCNKSHLDTVLTHLISLFGMAMRPALQIRISIFFGNVFPSAAAPRTLFYELRSMMNSIGDGWGEVV